VNRARWDGRWHEWSPVFPAKFAQNTPIAAVSRRANHIDLFAVGADGGVYTAWWNEGWQDWSQLGEARFAEHTPITALTREANHIDLFAVGRDGGVYDLVGRFLA
jgi:hypothetical protein